MAADILGTALPVLFVYRAAAQPHPEVAAATAALIWLGVQLAHKRYVHRSLGESRGLVSALQDWLTLLGLLAVIRAATGESSAPAYALLALTPVVVLTVACRTLTHRHLTAQRRAAQAVCRALVVGEAGAVDEVVGQLASGTDHAYVVIGAVPVGDAPLRSGVPESGRLNAAPDGERSADAGLDADAAAALAGEITLNLGIPVPPAAPAGPDGAQAAAYVTDGETVLEASRRHGAEMVLVVPGAQLGGDRLRRLSWAVQDAGLRLVIASGLTEVALRRVRLDTAAGLNLLHVAAPVRRGPQLVVKNTLDRSGAALGLLLLAPLFAVLAAVVRLDSRGPVLYRQLRIGHRGVPFTMWKFRSMVTEAEQLRPALAAADEQDGPTFKIRRDPRVTRAGRLLRRTSLDELPQLVNVLRGEMSLVGPRPPLPDEVAAYGPVELRRLHVKPGMTGPWQVGGRSELTWDESLALDLRYADNWSLTMDADVLARTFRAVADGRGAY
nr:exopolysaccharide biosynthesis polyprenyl glycosylphosphotransferase [Streptomyces armeniacus]